MNTSADAAEWVLLIALRESKEERANGCSVCIGVNWIITGVNWIITVLDAACGCSDLSRGTGGKLFLLAPTPSETPLPC